MLAPRATPRACAAICIETSSCTKSLTALHVPRRNVNCMSAVKIEHSSQSSKVNQLIDLAISVQHSQCTPGDLPAYSWNASESFVECPHRFVSLCFTPQDPLSATFASAESVTTSTESKRGQWPLKGNLQSLSCLCQRLCIMSGWQHRERYLRHSWIPRIDISACTYL